MLWQWQWQWVPTVDGDLHSVMMSTVGSSGRADWGIVVGLLSTCQSCALLLRGTLKTVLQGITSCAIDFASRTLYVSYGSGIHHPHPLPRVVPQKVKISFPSSPF